MFAALVTADDDHEACRTLIESATETLVIPAPVFVELECLLYRRATLESWVALAEDVAGGAYSVFPLDSTAILAAAELQRRYRDLPLGLVDAAVFGTCEALGERKVATLDRRHFSVLRTASGAALDLLPGFD